MLVGAIGWVGVPARAQQPDPLVEKVQTLLDSKIDSHVTPGLALAIFQNGRLRCNLVSGLRRVDEPENRLTPEDRFHLGSCTKAMTATLIGILVDEGKLDWSDSLADRLPQILDKIDPIYHEVTLWQLLTHRGGIPRDGPGWTEAGVNTLENRLTIVKKALAQKPESLQVGDYHYSNLGYVIAGLFAETLEKESYESLLKRKVWDPLGMTSAGFGVPDSQQPAQQPWGHAKTQKGLNPIAFDNPPSMAAAGATHMTLADWSRFAAVHLDLACRDHHLLSYPTLARLHQPYSEVGPLYAAGWLLQKNRSGTCLSHAGSNTFWFASIRLCPEQDMALLVAANGPLATAAPTVDEIVESVWNWLELD